MLPLLLPLQLRSGLADEGFALLWLRILVEKLLGPLEQAPANLSYVILLQVS